jgi:hypothetical protein
MPSRVLREGILTSERVHRLSWQAELFYRRLMSVADDYGLYLASTALIRVNCYPLCLEPTDAARYVREDDVQNWLSECLDARLVRVYTVEGKSYLAIMNFRQRLRTMKRNYPFPPFQLSDEINTNVRNDGQNNTRNATNGPSDGQSDTVVRNDSPETKRNETKGEGKEIGGQHDSHNGNLCQYDGQDDGIAFEPVKRGLYPREYEDLLKRAKGELNRIRNDDANWLRDLTDEALELVKFIESKGEPGLAQRKAEILARSGSYEKTNLKPKPRRLCEAWRARITEINNAMNGVRE